MVILWINAVHYYLWTFREPTKSQNWWFGLVILKTKQAFVESFHLKAHHFHAYYLGTDRSS